MHRLKRTQTPQEAAAGPAGSPGSNDDAATASSRSGGGASASGAAPCATTTITDTFAKHRSAIQKMGMKMGRKIEKLTTQTVLGLDRMVHPAQHQPDQDAHAGEELVDIVGTHVAPQTEGNVLHHLRSIHVGGVPNAQSSLVIPSDVARVLHSAGHSSAPPRGLNGAGSDGSPAARHASGSVRAASSSGPHAVAAGAAAFRASPALEEEGEEEEVLGKAGRLDSEETSRATPAALHARGDLLLLVVVHSARNLPPIMPDTNSVNPFVRLTMGDLAAPSKGSGRPDVATCTTRTVWRNKNPVWEESFLFEIRGMPDDSPISAVVYHNYGVGNIRMGQTRATLKRLFTRFEVNRAMSSWLRLGPRNLDKSQRGQWQGLEGDICFTQALVDRNLAPTLQPMIFSMQQLTPLALQQRLQGKTLKVTLHTLRLHLKRAEEMAGIMQVLADKDWTLSLEVQVGRTVAKRSCRAVHAVAAHNDPLDVTLTLSVSGGGYLLVPLDSAFQVQEALFWTRKRQEQEIGDIKIYIVHTSKGTLARTQIPCWDVPTEEQLASANAGDCDCVRDAQTQLKLQQSLPRATAPAVADGLDGGASGALESQSVPGDSPARDQPAAAAYADADGSLHDARASTGGPEGTPPRTAVHVGPDDVVYPVGDMEHQDLRAKAAVGKLENGLTRDSDAYMCKDGKHYLRRMDDYERVMANGWDLRVSCVMISDVKAAVLARKQAATDDKVQGSVGVVTTVAPGEEEGSGAGGGLKGGPDDEEEAAGAGGLAAGDDNASMLLPPPLETSCCDCTINAPPAAVFQALFDHNHPVFKNMVTREKLKDINPEPWAPGPDKPGVVPPKGSKRVLRYTRPLSVPAGPKSCAVEEVHELHASSSGGWVAMIKVSTTAPKGDSFYVNIQFAVSRVSGNSSRLVSSCAFVLVKSLGLLKSVVQGAALAGSKRGVLDRVADITAMAASGDLAALGTAGRSLSSQDVPCTSTTTTPAVVVVANGDAGPAVANVVVASKAPPGLLGNVRRAAAAALPFLQQLLYLVLLALLVHAVYSVAQQLQLLNETLRQQIGQHGGQPQQPQVVTSMPFGGQEAFASGGGMDAFAQNTGAASGGAGAAGRPGEVSVYAPQASAQGIMMSGLY